MPSESPTSSSRPAVRVVFTACLVALGAWVLWDFLPALVWAVVLAVASWPLFRTFRVRFGERGEARTMAPLAFTLLVGLVFLVPLGAMAAALGREAFALARLLPDIERTGLPVPDWAAGLPVVGHSVAAWWQENLVDPQSAEELFGRLDRNVLIEWARELGSQLVRRGTVLAFTLLTLFFLYRDGEKLAKDIEAMMLRLVGPQGRRVLMRVVLAVRGTVNGLVLVGLAEGLLLGIAYLLLGVSHPALFGGSTAVLGMIPFGAPLVFGVAAALLLVTVGKVQAIALLVIGGVTVFVADHFVRPALIGGAAHLPFLWVLLGILGGLQAFGLLGLFLGPAVMAALVAMWREWVAFARETSEG